MKTYVVSLEAQEHERLRKIVSSGKAAAFKIRHANILLQSDVNAPGWTDTRVAEGLGVYRFAPHRVAAQMLRRRGA